MIHFKSSGRLSSRFRPWVSSFNLQEHAIMPCGGTSALFHAADVSPYKAYSITHTLAHILRSHTHTRLHHLTKHLTISDTFIPSTNRNVHSLETRRRADQAEAFLLQEHHPLLAVREK
jgi:hypothetical protein